MKQLARILESGKALLAKPRAKTMAATAAFLALSFLFVYAVIRLFGGFVARELKPEPSPDAPVAEESDVQSDAAPNTPEPLAEVFTVVTPEPEPSESPAALETPEALPLPTAGPELTRLGKTSFTDENMDFVLLGFAKDGGLDVAVIVAIRNKSCTMIFVPKNLLDSGDRPLSRQKSAKSALAALSTAMPVDFSLYVSLEMKGLKDCINAAGGVELAGKRVDGTAAADYIGAGDGAEELIRITRMQTLLSAYVTEIRSIGLIRIAAMKAAASGCVDGNLTTGQYLMLLNAARKIPSGNYDYKILPVNSVSIGGKRCYCADETLVNQMARQLYSFD